MGLDVSNLFGLRTGVLRSRTYIEGYSEEEVTKRNPILIYVSIGLHSGPPSTTNRNKNIELALPYHLRSPDKDP